MREVYMDNAATHFDFYANPSSIHEKGRQARKALEEARAKVARHLNAHPGEIYFTSGGTESDNWVIQRAVKPGDQIITSSIEHPAVLNACKYMQSMGCEVTYLPVNSVGAVSPHDLEKSIQPHTRLISIMYVNNEIGTIEPIRKLAQIANMRGIPFHTDAVQAAGFLPIDVEALGIDYLSLSGHKFGGLKGTGVLYMRKGNELPPLLFGGHQEHGLRPGTENVLGAKMLADALEFSLEEDRTGYIRSLRERFVGKIFREVTTVFLNGTFPQRMHPGIINFLFPGVESEALLARLNSQGVYCSAGSACTSGSLEPSHVLTAIGLTPEEANSCIRFSLGRNNTAEEVDYAADCVIKAVHDIRELNGYGGTR